MTRTKMQTCSGMIQRCRSDFFSLFARRLGTNGRDIDIAFSHSVSNPTEDLDDRVFLQMILSVKHIKISLILNTNTLHLDVRIDLQLHNILSVHLR